MMSLDDTLAAWAATVHLPAAAAEDIYQQVIATPRPALSIVPGLRTASALSATPALSPAWWRRFTADFTARMVASTRPAQWAA